MKIGKASFYPMLLRMLLQLHRKERPARFFDKHNTC